MSGLAQCLCLCSRPVLVGMMSSGFLRAVACVSVSFCFQGWMILHGMDVPDFLGYSSVDGHLDCFRVLAVVTNAAMT